MRLLLTLLISIVSVLEATQRSQAQAIPDRTLGAESSVVFPLTTNGLPVQLINGGALRGSNLFHSFSQFSIAPGTTAVFNNRLTIQNIITRVTGGGLSQIDGILSSNGTANFILVNPAGIQFGKNALLNVGGSFLGTTAESIVFPDGKSFSASAGSLTTLLSVEVPSGLQFGNSPAPISVNTKLPQSINLNSGLTPSSVIQDPRNAFTLGLILASSNSSLGLLVPSNRTLALIGGRVTINDGNLAAPGGRVEIGSVDSPGIVKLQSSPSWSFDYSGISRFEDISLQNSTINVSSKTSGNIRLRGSNITLDQSRISSAILEGGREGLIDISATNNIGILNNSTITSVNLGGDRGTEIQLKGRGLQVIDSQIVNSTFGRGASGDVDISIVGDSVYEGVAKYTSRGSTLNFPGGILAFAAFGAGSPGNVTISTGTLTLSRGAIIEASTGGFGNGGNISIDAQEVNIVGGEPLVIKGIPTIFNTATGIYTNTAAGTENNAGSIRINTSRLRVLNAASIRATTLGNGNGGSVQVFANEFVELIGRNILNPTFYSLISVSSRSTSSGSNGASGEIFIQTPRLTLDNSLIDASTVGKAAGGINIEASTVQLRRSSEINVSSSGISSGGNLFVNADTLVLLEGSRLNANSQSTSGGRVVVNASGLFVSPDSSVTATSLLGPEFNGIVILNTPNPNLISNDLKPDVIPESPQIANVCVSQSQAAVSSFTNTGAGGLPVSPQDPLSSSTAWQDTQAEPDEQSVSPQVNTPSPTTIVEAQGWRRNGNNTISLTTEPTTTLAYSPVSQKCG